MGFKSLCWGFAVLCLVSCASLRQNAVCSEIRYRLDNMDYNDDQKEWIEEEWRACIAERDSLAIIDGEKYETLLEEY